VPDLPRAIGRYAVVKELGRGGMGVVYEVRHPEIPRPLALKQVLASAVTPEALLRFAREGQLLARVSHRGVVRVHQLDHAPQGPILVTDLVYGRPLSELARDGRLAPREPARLVREVADAVVALHAAGVVHRDIKGDNVLVQADGQPVLVDFGLGRDVQDADSLTKTGTVLGTPTHMAPEQAAGASVGPATDTWGLGALLFEALTGRPPFVGKTVTETLRQVLHDEAPSPTRLRPEVPRALDALVRGALVKDPADRPSPAALRDSLDAVLGDQAGPGRRRPAGLAAGLVAAALVAAGLVAAGRRLEHGGADGPAAPPPSDRSSASTAPAQARSAGVVASIVSRAAGLVCRVEVLPGATRGAFTGDHLVTWTPGALELQVWEADAAGALAPRRVTVDGAIVAVAVDPDLPDGDRPLAAVVTTEGVLAVPLQDGPPVLVAQGSHGHAGLLLGPPRVVVASRSDRLALLTPGEARGPSSFVPSPAPAAIRALAAGSGTLAVLDEEHRVHVWTDRQGAEGIFAPHPGTSIAVAHGRALVGAADGHCSLYAMDMTPLGEIQAGVKAPVDAVSLAHGVAALLVGPWLVFTGEVGPPWDRVPRPEGADGVALDPSGRVALVATPRGVEVWALERRLAPFAADGAAGLTPSGRLPPLDSLTPGASPEVAWLDPDRVVVAGPILRDRRRLRVWDLHDGRARPALAVDTPACGLAVVGADLLLEETAGPLFSALFAPALGGAPLVAPEPGGAALVGVSRDFFVTRAPLSAGEASAATGAGPPEPAWALASPGKEPHSITGLRYGHEGRVAGVAFLADDELVSLSTGASRPVRPGRPPFAHELRRWRLGPSGWSPAGPPARWADEALRVGLVVSPDGRRLAVPGADGRVDLFAVGPAR
jgi:hypothetical protein